MNKDRALTVAKTIEAYTRLKCSEDEPEETNVVDLLADLMHFCDAVDISFKQVLRIAEDHYIEEA